MREALNKGDLRGRRGHAAARKAPGGAAILKFLFSPRFVSFFRFTFFPLFRSIVDERAFGAFRFSSHPVFRDAGRKRAVGNRVYLDRRISRKKRETKKRKNHGSLPSTKTSTSAAAGRRRDLFFSLLFLSPASSALRCSPDLNSNSNNNSSSFFFLLFFPAKRPRLLAVGPGEQLPLHHSAGRCERARRGRGRQRLLRRSLPFAAAQAHHAVLVPKGARERPRGLRGDDGAGGVPSAGRGDEKERRRRGRRRRQGSRRKQQQDLFSSGLHRPAVLPGGFGRGLGARRCGQLRQPSRPAGGLVLRHGRGRARGFFLSDAVSCLCEVFSDDHDAAGSLLAWAVDCLALCDPETAAEGGRSGGGGGGGGALARLSLSTSFCRFCFRCSEQSGARPRGGHGAAHPQGASRGGGRGERGSGEGGGRRSNSNSSICSPLSFSFSFQFFGLASLGSDLPALRLRGHLGARGVAVALCRSAVPGVLRR